MKIKINDTRYVDFIPETDEDILVLLHQAALGTYRKGINPELRKIVQVAANQVDDILIPSDWKSEEES